jgi:hypothetical protein
MKAPLQDTIKGALGNSCLTYREITDVINRHRLYLPKDGTLVAVAQVRATGREHSGPFSIDRALRLIEWSERGFRQMTPVGQPTFRRLPCSVM